MSLELTRPVRAAELCRDLGLALIGRDRELRRLCGLDVLADGGLSFILKDRLPPEGAAGTVFAGAAHATGSLAVIGSEKPRLDFIRAQYRLQASPGFVRNEAPPSVHPTVRVGSNTVIEPGVSVGEGTVIGSCVVLKAGTRIGRFCEIKSGAVIGEPGFGFERDENNRPLKMIHMGGVSIGDHVEVGSLTTVVRGALGDTVLEDYVKLDDHVHIAHNCRVGEGAMITACAELSGSVRVGKNAWLAPNCTVMQKVVLGDGCFIGLGAVVARDVEPGAKMFGNPAKKIPSAG